MLILTGQMSRQAPQRVEAKGNCAAALPKKLGLITAPIGPE
jgi:hypothetical protein